ncbi:MAG: DUF3313 family protein [Burkholderiaceae bacterium]|nr:DUF3313 family protein [Burkholderiaceae bacterium]
MTIAHFHHRLVAGAGMLALVIGLSAHWPVDAAQTKLPDTTPEGLKLVPNAKVSAVYLRDGADFSGYDKVAILDCYVAFRKDWKRDQNQGANPFRVSDSDMAKIKTQLADEFKKVFARELTAKGQTMVTAAGPGVLILRPAIINLDVVAPDTMKPGSRTFSTSAGQATLLLELYDSVTSELLARVYDTESIGESNFIQVQNGVTNRAEADQVLTKWARQLAAYLEHARGMAKPDTKPTKP